MCRPGFHHKLRERGRATDSNQTPAKQVIHHRSFIVAVVRGPKSLINFNVLEMQCFSGHVAWAIEVRLADSKAAMSSASRRSYESHVGQLPFASIHSGCCAMRSRCSCSCNSAYVRISWRLIGPFKELSCSPREFMETLLIAWEAAATPRSEDSTVQRQGGCALSLLDDRN
jgi:hypothetical protein